MRNNSLASQVRAAYSQDKLARILTLREDRFGRAFAMQTVTVEQRWPRYRDAGRPENYYHFRDNGSRVLAVAHLDTVVRQKGRVPRFRDTKYGPHVVSGALDDRLGAYVILDLLPKLGVTCDWLLTVGEESGQSTAEHFEPGKDYDWIIEFDRMGTDVVMYQYEDRASVRAVEASGAITGHGSFSDIAYLEHVGVKAFNWGVGYRGDYHSERGHAYLDDTFDIVAKYLRFHAQNAGKAMPHDSCYGEPAGRRTSWWDDADDEYVDCEICGELNAVDTVTGYCTECGACCDCGLPENDGCMCYVPRHIREEAARTSAPAAVTERDNWRDLTFDDYLAARPGAWPDIPTSQKRSPSIAPPWSEHSPANLSARGRHEAAKSRWGWTTGAHDAGPSWASACDRCAARWPEAAAAARVNWPASEGSADIHPESSCPGCARCMAPGTFRIATGAIHVIPAHQAGTSDGCPDCADDRMLKAEQLTRHDHASA